MLPRLVRTTLHLLPGAYAVLENAVASDRWRNRLSFRGAGPRRAPSSPHTALITFRAPRRSCWRCAGMPLVADAVLKRTGVLYATQRTA